MVRIVFSKGKQCLHFIKRNVIQKLAHKVKYISEIKISWLTWEQCGKNQYKKKEHSQHSLVLKLLRQLLYYLNAIIPMIFVLLWKCSW